MRRNNKMPFVNGLNKSERLNKALATEQFMTMYTIQALYPIDKVLMQAPRSKSLVTENRDKKAER